MFSGAIDPVFPELSSHHYWWIQAVCNEFYPLKLQKPLRLIMPNFFDLVSSQTAAQHFALLLEEGRRPSLTMIKPRSADRGIRLKVRRRKWSTLGAVVERLLLLAAEWYRVLQSELLQENDEHVAKAPPEVRLSPQKLNDKADRLADGFSPYSTIVQQYICSIYDSQTWLAGKSLNKLNRHLNGKVSELNGGLRIAIFTVYTWCIHLSSLEQSKYADAIRPSIHAVQQKPLAFVQAYIAVMLIVTIATSLQFA